jgi:probable F420-dependent oxidoreductase
LPATDPAGTSAAGTLGVWSSWDRLDAPATVAFAERVESLGYDRFWTQEGVGREPFALLGHLSARTSRIGLGVGIAQTTARDALAAHAAAATVQELSGGRMLMGLGVGHQEMERVRGHAWRPPLTAMREYLDAYAAARYRAPLPFGEPPLILAALRPGMLRLAAERADGAFLYCVPTDAVREARAILDERAAVVGRARPVLVVSAPARLATDSTAARSAARRYLDRYLTLPNYLANLARLGFTEVELARPGGDRLVDALVAWGDEAAVRARLAAYRAAGADEVALIPLTADGQHADLETLERLAPYRQAPVRAKPRQDTAMRRGPGRSVLENKGDEDVHLELE